MSQKPHELPYHPLLRGVEWRSQNLKDTLTHHEVQNRYLQLGIEVGGDIRIRHTCYSKITAPSVNQNI